MATLEQVTVERNGILYYEYVRVDNNGHIIKDIKCGDIITCDENGNVITVNGEQYTHVQ